MSTIRQTLHEAELYAASDVLRVLGDREFLLNLERHYGLVRLGRNPKAAMYRGRNVFDALERHARDERVPPAVGRLRRSELRRLAYRSRSEVA